MTKTQDYLINIEMYFEQIKTLCTLLTENDNNPNLITLTDLAELGIAETKKLKFD